MLMGGITLSEEGNNIWHLRNKLSGHENTVYILFSEIVQFKVFNLTVIFRTQEFDLKSVRKS